MSKHHFMLDDDAMGKVYDAKLYKRLFLFAKPYFLLIVVSLILLLFATVSELFVPILTKIMVDRFIKAEIQLLLDARFNGLVSFSIIFFCLLFLFSLIRYAQINLMFYVSQRILVDIREKLFVHLKKLSLSFFQKQPVGRLVTRVINDIEVLNEFFTAGLVGVLADVFVLLGIVIFMLVLNWKLALVSYTIIPILFFVSAIFRKFIRPVYRDLRKILAKINAFFAENISGMKIVQIFNRQKKHTKQFDKEVDQYFEKSMKSVKVYSVFFPFVNALSAFALGLVLWFGGIQHFKDVLTLGTLIAFTSYVQRFFRPIRDLSQKYNILQNSMASSERIFKLLDMDDKIVETELPEKLENVLGKIEFKNVWFAYNEDQWVLKDVSFIVNPGEKIALVGATGSGKTTIAMLIDRFFDIQKGTILLDGKDIKQISKTELRKTIAIVLQDVFLFSGT
ncbi:ATP-binding cassette domain-containing protein, partial [Candidatus Dependentiae bacterium]|nr:ATP-binding cassette domain-containing protein [Candidatus Dependentiae bacterium]